MDEVLHIPVTLQKVEPADTSPGASSDQRRTSHYGMVYFPEGTTANAACEYIQSTQRKVIGDTGLWLLQMKPGATGGAGGAGVVGEDGFVRIKDSKHKLVEGPQYSALHYTGRDMFLVLS